MRFSFRKKDDDGPRWVDSSALGWTPDEPLDFVPRVSDVPVWQDEPQDAEPRAAIPEPVLRVVEPAPDAAPALPEPAPAPQVQPVEPAAPEPALRIVEPAPQPKDRPATPLPANSNTAPRLLLVRLGIGFAQGVALCLLLQARDADIGPGSDPALFGALFLALLFAPTMALEGLGEIEHGLLALWSGTVAFTLGTLSLYQQWRMPGAPAYGSVTFFCLVITILGIAQVLLRASLQAGKPVAGYRIYFDTAWTLAARLLVWGVLTGIAFALIGSGNSLLNWLRAHHPAVPLLGPSLLILPMLGLVSAGAFQITAKASWARRQTTRALLTCCTIALPLLIGASLLALAMNFSGTPLPLAVALGLAALLLVACNTSYRGDDARGRWRKAAEGIATPLILALVIVAGVALHLRVLEFGWTANRVMAAAAILLLALYGLSYGAAALIGFGGGLWMKPIERANLALALLTLAACLALTTPLADPLRLAVKAQTARAAYAPASFDFTWMRRDGGRFGHDALLSMAKGPNAEIGAAAGLALSAPVEAESPTPTGIGANITVRTPGARLPDSLLDQDWSGAAVPPCLTRPALACDAWFLDLDGDGSNEILLVYGNDARWWASVMKQDQGKWAPAATLASPPCGHGLAAMRTGGVALANPLPGWRDVLVAGLRLPPTPAPKATLPCPG